MADPGDQRGLQKPIVDWVNGHAKMKTRVSTVAATQNLLREWWLRGIRLRQRTADWVTHAFREHNKEAGLWADKGAKVRPEEWVDTAQIAWSGVSGLCGFLDGSCDNGNCGASILIVACSDLQGWSPFYKKCGLVPGIVCAKQAGNSPDYCGLTSAFVQNVPIA